MTTGRARGQVLGISTLNVSQEERAADGLRLVECEHIKQILDRQESKEEIIQEIKMLLERSPTVRTNLLTGKLQTLHFLL